MGGFFLSLLAYSIVCSSELLTSFNGVKPRKLLSKVRVILLCCHSTETDFSGDTSSLLLSRDCGILQKVTVATAHPDTYGCKPSDHTLGTHLNSSVSNRWLMMDLASSFVVPAGRPATRNVISAVFLVTSGVGLFVLVLLFSIMRKIDAQTREGRGEDSAKQRIKNAEDF